MQRNEMETGTHVRPVDRLMPARMVETEDKLLVAATRRSPLRYLGESHTENRIHGVVSESSELSP